METMLQIYRYFIKGGVVMWPLLVCALAAAVVAVERMIFMWRMELVSDDARLKQVHDLVENGAIKDALQVAEEGDDPAARVIASGLKQISHGLADAMQIQAERELDKMKQGLSVMDTIITMAPLLGILGTVTGIIRSFNLLNAGGLQDPRVATGGLAEALITTAAGLVVALCALMPFNFLQTRIQKAVRRIDHAATQIEVAYRSGHSRDRK